MLSKISLTPLSAASSQASSEVLPPRTSLDRRRDDLPYTSMILSLPTAIEMTTNPPLRDILQPHIERLLASREPPKTICPSEVARSLTSHELDAGSVSEWRESMPEIRRMVATMRQRGEVEVLQKGSVLQGDLGQELERVVGPIRIRRTR